MSIYLYSTFYKIVAKVLANKLKPILSYIINYAQSIFIKGRDTIDNISLAHEICLELPLPLTNGFLQQKLV